MMKCIFKFIFISVFLIIMFAPVTYGNEIVENENSGADEFNDEMEIFKNAIPEDVREILPDEIFDLNNSEAISESAGVDFFLKQILDDIKSALFPAAKTMTSVLALIIICALFNTLKNSFGSSSLASIFDMCCGICVSLTLFRTQYAFFETAQTFILSLCKIMNAMIPVTGAVMTAAGNFSGAAVSGGMMMLFITLLENICASGLMPVMNICFSFSLIGAVSGSLNLSGISKLVRWIYTFSLTTIMTVFGFVMSIQSTLSQSTDNLVIKTVRFAVGGMIPLVGGAVSDALRTVGGSLALIKNTAGILGIIIIALTLLPVIISLIINKFVLSICAAVADTLDCGRESGIINEMNGLCGFVIALTSVSALFFIFALTIFINTSLAISV